MFLVSSCSCLCPIHWSQVFSREWRCSWSSADRRCSNYIWVINNFIAYKCAYYIRGLTVYANEGKSIISCRPLSKHLHRSVPLYRRLQSTLWYRGGVYQGQNNSLVSTLQWCPNCQEKKTISTTFHIISMNFYYTQSHVHYKIEDLNVDDATVADDLAMQQGTRPSANMKLTYFSRNSRFRVGSVNEATNVPGRHRHAAY